LNLKLAIREIGGKVMWKERKAKNFYSHSRLIEKEQEKVEKYFSNLTES